MRRVAVAIHVRRISLVINYLKRINNIYFNVRLCIEVKNIITNIFLFFIMYNTQLFQYRITINIVLGTNLIFLNHYLCQNYYDYFLKQV